MSNSVVVRKPFTLQGEWTPSQAYVVDDLLNKIVQNQTNHRHGSYTGTGKALTVPFAPTISDPLILALFNRATGAHTIILEPGVNITAWTSSSFTLAPSSTFNSASMGYLFFLLADVEL